MKKEFKFSIVMAIYNMESYLAEAIDSLVNQTIGFEDNLQVLLVNDGSIDNSESICKEYIGKYPDNITYIYKENGGVSDARNRGLEYAKGELVNFLDADDKLESDALEKVYCFYEKNKEEVDLISIPLCFFEGKEGDHVLNYKFTTTRVIDIFKEPTCFQMHISSSFIKLDEMRKYSFNKMLTLGEDAEVANKIILYKGKYGVVSDSRYLYRKRSLGNSAIQGARASKANYIPALKYLHLELVRFSLERYGKVPEYLQWLMIYDIGGKIVVPNVEEFALSYSETDEFLGYVKQALNHISDEIILGRTELRRYYNLYMLQLKYGGFHKEQFTIIANKEDAVLCKENHVVDFLYRQKLHIKYIEQKENILRLTGYCNFIFDSYEYRITIEHNGKAEAITLRENKNYQINSLNRPIAKGYEFFIEIPLDAQKITLKARAKLGKTNGQIKLMLDPNAIEGENAVTSEYTVEGDGKVLTLKKNVEKTAKTSDEANQQNSSSVMKAVKHYIKSRVMAGYAINKIVSSKGEVSDQKNKLFKRMLAEIPVSYRFYLLNYKYGEENQFGIAVSNSQACLYNGDFLYLARLSETVVNIDKMSFDRQKIMIKGFIMSPFPVNQYKLNCWVDKKSYDCKLTVNARKSIWYNKEMLVANCEYEIEIPIGVRSEVLFELSLGLCKNIPQVAINMDKLCQSAEKMGYKVELFDCKKIVVTC